MSHWRGALCAAFGMAAAGCGCSDDGDGGAHDATAVDAPGVPDGHAWDAAKADVTVGDASPDTALFDASGLDAKDDPAYAWLFDDSAWKSLSSAPGCDLREADLGKLKYPGHVWGDCGPGCRAAEVMPGTGVIYRGGYRYGTGARPAAGDIHVFLTAAVRFPPAVRVAESFRLGTDAPAGLLALYGDACKLAFAGATSTRMAYVYPNDAETFGTVTAAPLKPGESFVFASPPFKVGQYGLFDFDGGWGAIVGQANVAVTFDLTSTKLTSVYSSPALQNEPRTNGAAVVWEDWGSRVVRGWTATGGSRVLASGPWDAGQVAISDTRIVWIGATGPNTYSGSYQTARLYWSPRALDPDAISIQAGPVLPAGLSMAALATHGKWAALQRASAPPGAVVANLETGELWNVPTPAGRWQTVLAVSDSELLLADAVQPMQQSQMLDLLVRYDLAKLADYATKLP